MKKLNQKKKLERAINVGVSPKAHEKMREDAYKAVPRRTLRQHLNIINKLPEDL